VYPRAVGIPDYERARFVHHVLGDPLWIAVRTYYEDGGQGPEGKPVGERPGGEFRIGEDDFGAVHKVFRGLYVFRVVEIAG
jgi:hypothetical protein